MRITVAPAGAVDEADPYPALIRALGRARAWFDRLAHGESVKQLSEAERVTPSFVSRTVRLAFLAPDIALSIMEGRQPGSLAATRLVEESDQLPLAWTEQRELLGFPSLQ